MIALALILSGLLTVLAGLLRFGGASLLRTHRADALRDAAAGRKGAARVATLLEDPVSVQPSIGMVHIAVLVAAAIPGTWALAALVSGPGLVGVLLALGVVLVFAGDTLPRSVGRTVPRTPAYRLSVVLTWAVRLGRRAADFMADDSDETEADADDDDTAEEQEIELISSVLEFSDTIVREVMVPRTDMVTVQASDSTDAALDVILACGRSRIPVTGDDLDDIVGVLYARDLLTLFDAGGGVRSVNKLMRPAHHVPETKRVSELFRELQREKVHLAIVVDEFGSTAGLVTMEDIIEEILGEIADEYDTEDQMVEVLSDGAYLVDARMSVDDLAALLGRELPDEDWDTVGGLMLALAGRVPEEGETFALDRLHLTAERVQGRRIALVRVVAQ